MRIVLTGANGYIGRHTVKNLLDKGHEVIAVGRTLDKVDERATKILANLFDQEQNYFEAWQQPDLVIHLAWQDGFIHHSPSHINDLPAHFNLIKNLVDGGLKQVVIMGSMHEIGYYEGKIDETTPTNPISLYGIAKNALRQSLHVYLKDKDVVFQWLRGFYIVGDDLSNHSLFTKILQKEAQGEKRFPFTEGHAQYDFIHIEDLADQIASVALQTDVVGLINCCSGQPVRIKDKVEAFLKEHHLQIKPDYGAFPTRPYDSNCIYGDNTKIAMIMRQRHAR